MRAAGQGLSVRYRRHSARRRETAVLQLAVALLARLRPLLTSIWDAAPVPRELHNTIELSSGATCLSRGCVLRRWYY
jgi:hypothetical protein